jgi:hypothetical protein
VPRIFKTCPKCRKQNVIPVSTERPPDAAEHRCECGTLLFDYRETFDHEQ